MLHAQKIDTSDSASELDKDALIASLKSQNASLHKENERLESDLHQIFQSRSWRLTEGCRKIARYVRMVFPLWSFKKASCTLEPINSVTYDGAVLSIVGPTARAKLAPISGSIPTGWVRFSAELDQPLVASIYYRTGPAFSDRLRVHLPLIDCPRASHLFFLPADTKELRFDPFHPDGSFRFSKIMLSRLGSLQVVGALFKKYAGSALRDPRQFIAKFKKLIAILREGGFVALRVRLFADNITNNYQDWVQRYDTLDDNDRKKIQARIDAMPNKPLISVIVPTYNTPRKFLIACIESVRTQLYPHWELCIADDASKNEELRPLLEEYAQKDSRIKLHFRKENGHISKTSNEALALARGEFVALLDHDDELTEHALYLVAEEINAHLDADLIYSDEDKITGFGMRFNPHFKSDWNPDLFLSQNFVCHLSVYRTELVRKVGGFRAGFEGAQDWDLAWRVAEATEESRIRHIPHVLYHWRVIEGSTAASTSYKPYVLEAQVKTVSEHLERIKVPCTKVEILHSISHVRPIFPLPAENPRVSIIIPTRDQLKLLSRCVSSLREKAGYDNFEIIIVDNGSYELDTRRYLAGFQGDATVRVIRDDSPFNYSRLNNRAVAQASGSVIGLMNNDLEALSEGWLAEMLSQLSRPGIAAVGARLLYPNGLLQHGGVILGVGGVAGHSNKGIEEENPGYFNRAILAQNLSCVTAACMLVQKHVFLEVGGLDEDTLAVAFNDVDLCLKIRAKGYKIVYTPYARFYHYESASRGYEITKEKFRRFENEVDTMKKRWAPVLSADPYYNPNLSLLTEDFQFAFPPRAKKIWRE